MKSGAPIPEYEISHAEADTAIFTIYHILCGQGCSGAVILDTEDTDNYVQAAYMYVAQCEEVVFTFADHR